MADERIPYRKLGGVGTRQESLLAGSVSRVRLYLGPDHLLLVEKTNYRESYRRFYFRDIQAFLMLKTNRWHWFNMTFLALGLLFGVFGLLAGSGANLVLFLIAVLWFGLLGANWYFGQSCQCYLKTAVQYEELTPLRRERSAIKALAQLRGLIHAAQGPLPAATAPETAEPSFPGDLPPAAPAAS